MRGVEGRGGERGERGRGGRGGKESGGEERGEERGGREGGRRGKGRGGGREVALHPPPTPVCLAPPLNSPSSSDVHLSMYRILHQGCWGWWGGGGGGAAQLQPTQLRCHNTVIGALKKDGLGAHS